MLLLLLRFLFLVLRSSVFFWDMLRHWHVDVRTISLPAAPYGPASCQGPITMMNGKQGVVEFRNPFDKPTDFSLQACQGFWIDCWILLNCSTWGIVLKYDLNWFIWYCTGSYWYMYWFYIVVNCANDHFYWMWWCHAATVAPIQVDNPCFMVPMRTQRRQWREKEIERERGMLICCLWM